MKSGEKKLILVLLVLVLIVAVVAIVIKTTGKSGGFTTNSGNGTSTSTSEENPSEYVQNLDDGSKLNVSGQLQKTKTLDGLEFTNIQLREKDGITTLLADVENKNSKATAEKKLKIEILDKEGKTIAELTGTIFKLEPGAKTQLNSSISVDVSNAYDFKISNK